VRALQRYLFNPPMKLMVLAGLVPGQVLIETRGRRTGKRRTTVVGIHVEGATGWIVAEHGRHAGYVRNIEADPAVRVRSSRRWQSARAEVVPEDDPRARLEVFPRRHAAAVRRFGTDLTSIRVDLTAP
jgi:deazaflavin-dependent oxidoreductase (nitroreductase family)